MPMIGQMRHRVTIQTLAEASDGAGGFTGTWTDVATVWAKIEPLKGMEVLQAMQLEAPLTHKVFIRYRTGIATNGVRLKHEGRYFDIKQVRNLMESERWLELLVEEGKITAETE